MQSASSKIFKNATSWLGNYNDLLKTKIRIRLETVQKIKIVKRKRSLETRKIVVLFCDIANFVIYCEFYFSV